MRDIPDHMLSIINPLLLEEGKRAEYLHVIENAMTSRRVALTSPDKNSPSLAERTLYKIPEVELSHRKTKYSADLFFLLGTNFYSDVSINRAQAYGGYIDTGNAQAALYTTLHKIFEGATNKNPESMLSYALLKNASDKGRKIAYIRAHGIKSPSSGMLSLSSDPKTMKDEVNLSAVVKDIAKSGKYGLVLIDACNPEAAPIDTNGVNIPVILPMSDSYITSRHKAKEHKVKVYLPAA
ncbi:MAG TPA: hypothetical protein VF189_04925 [Patescibacteria group bacterium]